MRHAVRALTLGLFTLVAMTTLSLAEERPLLEQGTALYHGENFEEAIVVLRKARSESPLSAMAAFYLGMALKQTGDLKGAVSNLSDAATMKPPVIDAYLELADAFYVSRELDQALSWVKRSEEAGFRPPHSAFLKGLILSAQGRRGDAIQAFESAKRLDPSLTQAADFQLAIVLAADRKLARARDTLRALIAADPASEIASYAKEYEHSFTRIIESNRPLRLTVGLNYMYDDNAISNPSDATAREQIGNPTGERDHAFLGTLRLDYNPMLAGNAIFSAQYALLSTKYGNTDTVNDNPSTLINSLTLIPGIAFGASALTLPVNYSHVLLKEDRYQQLVTVRPTWSYQIAPQQILQTAFNYTRREMLIEPLVPEENRDADIFGGSLGHIFTFGEQGGMAGLRYDFSYEETGGANWVNRGHHVSLNSVVPLARTLKLNLSADVTLQDYLFTNTIFHIRRDDTTWLASAGISWNVARDIVVTAQYAHTTVDSSIPVYGYDRNTFTTGFEVSF